MKRFLGLTLKKSMLCLLISVVLLSVVGVFLNAYLNLASETFKDEIKIELGGKGTQTEQVVNHKVEGLNLYPGAYKECKLVFDAAVDGEFVISLAFKETEVGTLREFINVEIACQNVKIEKSLLELFDEYSKTEKTQQVKVALKKGESTTLSVRYVMPDTVGDEAQGATSKFNLVYSTAFANG